jgi:hypothetical protein
LWFVGKTKRSHSDFLCDVIKAKRSRWGTRSAVMVSTGQQHFQIRMGQSAKAAIQSAIFELPFQCLPRRLLKQQISGVISLKNIVKQAAGRLHLPAPAGTLHQARDSLGTADLDDLVYRREINAQVKTRRTNHSL